jgi:hypothetical protein
MAMLHDLPLISLAQWWLFMQQRRIKFFLAINAHLYISLFE